MISIVNRIEKNKKKYPDLYELLNERKDYVSSQRELYTDEDYIDACALFLLYERIYCDQEYALGEPDKQILMNDDILLYYFNQYKPFFSGNKIKFFLPDKDMNKGVISKEMLEVYNTIAYELKEENPYVKKMLRELFKVFYEELWINFKDKKIIEAGTLPEQIRHIPELLDEIEDNVQEELSKAEMKGMILINLFSKVFDIPISHFSAKNMSSDDLIKKVARKMFYEEINAYDFPAPVWADSIPSKEEYKKMINSDKLIQYLFFRYDIDLEKKSLNLPIYHRMKKISKRVFYFYNIETNREELIPSGRNIEHDLTNLRQAYFFLKWMYKDDEKITTDLLQTAAGLMNVINGYMEYIHHTMSLLKTALRVDDSYKIAKEYLESANNGKDPHITALKNECDKKDAEIEELKRKLTRLELENNQLELKYQKEHEKCEMLSKIQEDNADFNELEKLYVKQVDKQTELIDKLQSKITELDEENFKLSLSNIELKEVNSVLLTDNISIKASKRENCGLMRYGKEVEFYDNEIKEMLLEVINDYYNNYCQKDTRKAHIIEDILSANSYQGVIGQKRGLLKGILKKDSLKNVMKTDVLSELAVLGFVQVSDNNHIKMVYYNDARYTITVPKTSSDYKAPDNLYTTIKNLCL